jgi:hypothetical protein
VRDGTAQAGRRRRAPWTARLIRGTLIWLLPAALAWLAITPFYNQFLVEAGNDLFALVEHPRVTDLSLHGGQDAYVARRDLPPTRALAYTFRVTDVHFHLLLLAALFLGVPEVPWRRRLANLGLAALATIGFDILLVVFDVEFAYTTQLGSWSLAHYGAFTRNAFGLGRHLLDLPFKLALPLLLWAGFYLPRLLAETRPAGAGEGRPAAAPDAGPAQARRAGRR